MDTTLQKDAGGSKPRPYPKRMKQPPHRRMVFVLLPICATAVFFFGWRAAAVVAVAVAACYVTEAVFVWYYRQPISEAVFVTGLLMGLVLPPTIPLYMAALGGMFAVFFGKMVFGGFGRNIFNPAMSGRCFLYISFGQFMTGPVWYDAYFVWDGAWGNLLPAIRESLPGGFARWGAPSADALTSATPLIAGFDASDYIPMMFGARGGSIGETFTVLIVLAGLYLFWTKTADWRMTVGLMAGVFVTAFFHWLAGHGDFPTPFNPLVGASTMFVAVFMITDPITAARTTAGKWIYAALVGMLLVLIRTHSIWVAGAMFSTLIGNMFAPLIDHGVNAVKQWRKAKA